MTEGDWIKIEDKTYDLVGMILNENDNTLAYISDVNNDTVVIDKSIFKKVVPISFKPFDEVKECWIDRLIFSKGGRCGKIRGFNSTYKSVVIVEFQHSREMLTLSQLYKNYKWFNGGIIGKPSEVEE